MCDQPFGKIWEGAIDLCLLNWLFSPLLEDFSYETGFSTPGGLAG
jgi:hypothetical protein